MLQSALRLKESCPISYWDACILAAVQATK